jgi:ribulose bisphosphate carboxylase small subunit
MKAFPRMLSQRCNAFRVGSASDEIRSAYVQHILNDGFEMGSDFPHAEHARKLVTGWLSMCGNWLLVG